MYKNRERLEQKFYTFGKHSASIELYNILFIKEPKKKFRHKIAKLWSIYNQDLKIITKNKEFTLQSKIKLVNLLHNDTLERAINFSQNDKETVSFFKNIIMAKRREFLRIINPKSIKNKN